MVTHIGYYLHKDEIFYTQSFVDFANMDENETVERQVLGIAKTKFSKFNVLSCRDEFGKNIIVILSLNSGQILFNDLNIKCQLNRGDAILFLSSIKYEINTSYNIYQFAYTNKKELFGDGDIIFEVVANIKDQYRIRVRANTKEEAIEQANTIPVSEWHHPEIDRYVEDRQLIRHARWGNLTAYEVQQ